MAAIEMKFNPADVLAVKTVLGGVGNAAPRVMYRSINKTVDNTQPFAVDRIYNKLNLTKTNIRANFKKLRAYLGYLKGSLLSIGEPVPFIKFIGTIQYASGKGVGVQIFRSGRKRLFEHAFIAQMGSGHTGVFERVHYFKGPAKYSRERYRQIMPHLAEEYRLPIDEMTGPRVEDIYARLDVLEPVQGYADYRLSQNVKDQLDYELSRL